MIEGVFALEITIDGWRTTLDAKGKNSCHGALIM